MSDPIEAGAQLEIGQVWQSASGLTSREILDFETKLGGQNLVRYRGGSETFVNTIANVHRWIRTARATLKSKQCPST
jgi:hypothetical protein